MFLLIIIVVTSLSVSFLCSVLEATLLSISVIELSQRKEKGDNAAARLLALKEHQIDDSISAILTYNTIAHTIGAALSGWQAARVFGDAWVGVFSGVLTILILVITEIIPKTLGTVKASQLVGFVGLVLTWMIKPPMKWILVMTGWLTDMVAHGEHKSTTRGEVRAMLKIAERDGALAPDETRVMTNWLQFSKIKVNDVMTPRTVLTMLAHDETVEQAIKIPANEAYSRFPVFEGDRDHIMGYVLMRDLLYAAIDQQNWAKQVQEFVRPVVFIPESQSVAGTLRQFTQQHEHMGLVVDEHGGISGLVTIEDLIETGLGVEIVDEFDKVADLRTLASELRDKRLEQMQMRHNRIKK